MQNAREKKKRNPSTERESERKTHIEKKEVTAQKFAFLFLARAVINLDKSQQATNGNKQNKRPLQQFNTKSGAWALGRGPRAEGNCL